MNNELQKAAPLEMTYVPFGAKAEIKLTPAIVDRFITVKTRRGQTASYEDKIKFMMLCKSRELDPFVGDAFLVGYDGKDGPVFSLITAHQALLKRAEVNPAFDGMETGIIIEGKNGTVQDEFQGSFVEKGTKLLGGWCRVYRKDRSHVFYHAIDLKVYDTGMSRWEKDPAGMICKVAESGALRKAFPTQIGGLYSQEEMDAEVDGRLSDKKITTVAAPTSLDDFIDVEPVVVVDESVQVPADKPKKTPKKEPKFSPAYRDLYAQITACETATALDAITQLCKIAKIEEPELADLMLYAEERKPELS